MEMLAIETHRMLRHHRPLTIAYVDVDNFKLINDRYGHAAGDEFLRALCHHMGDCVSRIASRGSEASSPF